MKTITSTIIILTTTLTCVSPFTSRAKRHLLMPQGGTFKFIGGYNIPIKLTNEMSFVNVNQLQFQFPALATIEQLHYKYWTSDVKSDGRTYASNSSLSGRGYGRLELFHRRNNDVWLRDVVGKLIENPLVYGCVLKLICNGTYHADNLYDEILHIVLRHVERVMSEINGEFRAKMDNCERYVCLWL